MGGTLLSISGRALLWTWCHPRSLLSSLLPFLIDRKMQNGYGTYILIPLSTKTRLCWNTLSTHHMKKFEIINSLVGARTPINIKKCVLFSEYLLTIMIYEKLQLETMFYSWISLFWYQYWHYCLRFRYGIMNMNFVRNPHCLHIVRKCTCHFRKFNYYFQLLQVRRQNLKLSKCCRHRFNMIHRLFSHGILT